jgi:2-polyprenyl-6-methoxyphenol hydroxylase-like FAD-dependent oxidoreductase
MFGIDKPEVLIVGAGPVGQFAALTLARRGVAVRVVDRGIWPCAQSYALALHPRSLSLLAEMGLLDSVLEHASLVRDLVFYEGARPRARVRISGDGSPSSCLAVVRQDALEGLLEDALAQQEVHVDWRHEVARLAPVDDVVEATIDKFEKESRGYIVAHTEWVITKSSDVHVPFVIGADGYNSRVRRALKIDFPEAGRADYFAVFEFKSDMNLGQETRIVVGDRTTDVLWPLPGGYCRWSFQLPDYRDPQLEDLQHGLRSSGFDVPTQRTKERQANYTVPDSTVLDESHLKALIAERAPWFDGAIGELVWRSVVRFERRLAASFGSGRLWLAGDAAHLAGPVGVQSMNLGLEEAAHLAGVVAGILRHGEPMSNLEAYGEYWIREWRQLHGLERGIEPGPNADSWTAAHAARLAGCLPGHGPALAALATQLGLAVPSQSGSVIG